MAAIGAQNFAVLGLVEQWEWLYPAWGHVIVAPMLLLLCWLLSLVLARRTRARARPPRDRRKEAAARAAELNRAVVEAAGGDGADSCPPTETR